MTTSITLTQQTGYQSVLDSMYELRNDTTKNTQILDRFIAALTSSLAEQYAAHGKPYEYFAEIHSVSLEKLSTKEHGEYRFNGNRGYWADFLRPLFFTVGMSGSNLNKRMSTITLTPLAKEILFGAGITDDVTPRMAEKLLQQSPLDVYMEFHNNYKSKNLTTIKTPIDLDSLTAYIDYTTAQIATLDSSKQKLKQLLLSTLTHAKLIKQMAQGYVDYKFMQQLEKYQHDTTITDETWAEVYDSITPMLVQASFVSDFGRTYTSGVNLQSAPKEVRIAAIGASYHYDISASVYAWKNDLVRKISDFTPSYTLEYLDTKNQFRKHIATIVFPDAMESGIDWKKEAAIKQAKQILTAIGFGATASSPGWVGKNGKYAPSAIKQLCRDTDSFNRLIADPEFSSFINEQKQISKILVEYYNRTCVANDNINTPAKKVAYLYQQHEAELMKQVIVLAKQKTPGLEVKLQVHDALYTNMKIDLDTFTTVQEKWKSLKFDHDVAAPYKLKTLESENDREEREHREFMAEQERIARQRYGENSYEPFPTHLTNEQAGVDIIDRVRQTRLLNPFLRNTEFRYDITSDIME